MGPRNLRMPTLFWVCLVIGCGPLLMILPFYSQFGRPFVFAPHVWTASMALPTAVTMRDGRRLPAMPSLRGLVDPPVALRGQVTLDTSFGRELNRLAREQDVRLVLEIGTWYGGGSSWCIASGLRDSLRDRAKPDKWLLTLEMFEEAWEYASRTLSAMPATCMRAGTVGPAGYLRPDQMTPDDIHSEHFRLYYERDMRLAATTRPMLERLCKTYDFDLILIDGNEYTGFAEFEIINRFCRPRYLALHDTGTLKTRLVEAFLRASAMWAPLSHGMDAAGWAVYRAVES